MSVDLKGRRSLEPGSIPADVPTPCFVISEEAILANLKVTGAACGGTARLMPHVKTHRAEWIVKLLLREGVHAFKVATVREARMVLDAGAGKVVWAYPSVNKVHAAAFLDLAREHPEAELSVLVDSDAGWTLWRRLLAGDRPERLKVLVDLDPGMGRTGLPLDAAALVLAREIHRDGLFGGWHLYDGHIQDREMSTRQERIAEVVRKVDELFTAARAEGISTELIAGASYSFEHWPATVATYVAPGSWVYSSAQHDAELAHLGWTPSAFVLATVISRRDARATLDAGSKAISPDKPIADRFRWERKILMMSEEHVVVEDDSLAVGDRLLLLPRHACTTAYLYDKALVRTVEGNWEYRPQLGSGR